MADAVAEPTIEDVQKTPAWKRANSTTRAAMLDDWYAASPQKRAMLLARVRGSAPPVPAGLQPPTPSTSPSAAPTPSPTTAPTASGGGDIGGPIGQRVTQAGKFLFGDTPEEQGVSAGLVIGDAARLALKSNPLGRAAATVIPMGIGGYMGYKAHPEAPITGMIEGGAKAGALSLVPEVISRGVTPFVQRYVDTRAITNVVKNHIPAITPILERGVTFLDNAFRGTRGKKLAGDALDAAKQSVENILGDAQHFRIMDVHPAKAPLGERLKDMSFRQVDEKITALLEKGWKLSGDRSTAALGQEYRKRAYTATQKLIEQMSDLDPKMAEVYQAARQQFAKVKMMQRLFSKPGVIDEKARVVMRKLEKAVQVGRMREELDDFMPDMLKALFRGAPPTAIDIPGSIGFHPIEALRGKMPLLHPQLPVTVGANVPVPRYPASILPRWLMDYFKTQTNPAQAQQGNP